MFFDSRPSLSVVVALGLCVFVGIVNARWWRYREPGARASLTGSQVLLGLLNLLCSLACVYCVSWLGTGTGTGTGTGNWLTVVVGVLWVTVSLLRLCYLTVATHRQWYGANANFLALALFLTTNLPEQVYPLVWLQARRAVEIAPADAIWLGAAFASAVVIPLLAPGHVTWSDKASYAVSCSPVSRWWLYSWVSPLVKTGCDTHGLMNAEDLLPSMETRRADDWLQAYLDCRLADSSFKTSLWMLFRHRFIVMAFWAMLCGFAELLGTIGLHQLLLFLQRSPDTKLHPWFSVILFGSCPILRGLCMQTFEYFATHTIGDAKACITTAVYQKFIVLGEYQNVDVGQLQSNISADIDRLGTLRYTMMTVFMMPVELIAGSVILYRIMGWYYLPSLAFLLVTRYPLSKFIVSAQSSAQSKILQATDKRVTKTSESIRAMAAIKVLGHAQPFIERIIGERNQELGAIWEKMQVIVASESVSSLFTFIALLLSLVLYTVVGGMPLKPDIVFTVMAVFNIVNSMLGLSVLGAGQYAQAAVSLNRLGGFLDWRPDQTLNKDRMEPSCRVPDTFCSDLVRPGINIVTGDVGSGKSTLLQTVVADRQKLSVTPCEAVAYASQNPWLFKGSIKDNILFGSSYDEERYKDVISCCALEPDLATFKDYDMKDVGDGGGRLSGGQRHRVALARAVYSRANTVVLDDVLSGLDATTFDWITRYCILGPQLENRTVVLVSNKDKLLDWANLIVYMADGLVVETVRKVPVKIRGADGDDSLVNSPSITALDSGSFFRDDYTAEESSSTSDSDEDSSKTFGDLDNLRGRTGFRYMRKYICSFGCRSFIVSMIMFTIGAQAMDVVVPTWLSVWSHAYAGQTSPKNGFFIGIFTGLGVARVLLLVISLLLLYSGAWRASRDKHLEMLIAVFGATYAWTWRTPAGQVINRFSSDMASLDDTLFRTFRPVIETYLSITFRILTVSSLIPLFLLPSILLAGVALYIGHRYRFASTAVKHIYAASLTPLHHSVAEAASGLITIHAFRNELLLLDRFKADVDHHVQAWNAVSDLQRWLAVRMDLCVGLISFSVAILAIMQQHANASTVGLSLTLTTGLCTSLLYLVYLSSLLEVEMTSYYRIETYARDVPQESKPCEPVERPSDWPTQGAVNVQELTAGYSLDENEVLKDIDLNVKPGERVAIVGRTGSGKSSLALSLLRLTTRLRGSTNIDGIDVESLDVDQLRQRISLIPQDPTLFDGSLRFNLDPSGQACDRYLQTVLDDVAGTPNKWHLDDLVDGNGKNFSHGERQLIALGRAIVRQNRIVILDEGTASLDDASEARIHTVLDARFHDCTVIAIAHRLHSILDFDRVLVLDGGRVVEQGNPRELLTAGRGWFQTLYVQQCGPEADA